MTYDCPVAACDGHDFPRLIDKRVPAVAAVVDDVVEGFENPVGKPVLSHELPDVFLAVEFWCARRQWHQRHVAWDLQHFRAMPTGLIEQDDRVGTRGDLGCDLVEMELHGFAVASRQHEGGASPAFGADRTEQVGRFGPLIVRGAGTGALPGPAIGELVLLADPHLVLAPHLYRCARRKLRADLRHTAGKVFLNVSTASASCL